MSSARSRSKLVLLTGVAALGLCAWAGPYLWLNRVELFLVPSAWLRLRSIGGATDPAARDGERRGELRRRASVAAAALVRLQDPEFPADAELVRLERFRSLEGANFYLACFKTARIWHFRGADGYDTFSSDHTGFSTREDA